MCVRRESAEAIHFVHAHAQCSVAAHAASTPSGMCAHAALSGESPTLSTIMNPAAHDGRGRRAATVVVCAAATTELAATTTMTTTTRCPTPREASLGLNRGPAARWHRGQTLLPPLSRAVCITFVVEVFGSQPGARLRPVRQRCQWRRDFSGRRDKWWHGWRRSEAARRPRDWAWVRVRKSHLRSRED